MLTQVATDPAINFWEPVQESVAEHSFMTAFICLAMANMEPGVDAKKNRVHGPGP